MNRLGKYILIGAAVAAVGFLLWYFSSIVAYILISAVLSLIGKPVVDAISRIKIRGRTPPRFAGAAVALVGIWLLFIAFFRVMIPLAVAQFNELSSVDVQAMVNSFSKPLDGVQEFIHKYLPANARGFSLKNFIITKITNVFSVSMVASFFSSTANLIMSLLVALFSISFITFFFLKDDTLFYKGITILFPEKYEAQLGRALSNVNVLLRRYFIGILIESTAIMILNTVGLSLIGVKFETAVVIGLIAGILNVVPYVGPLVGTVVGTLIGLATHPDTALTAHLLPLTIWLLVVLLTTQLVDNVVFQPLIYGNSVKAHPLEIFIVLLIAGSVAGILGMLLAIPSYTVVRVFAKEFFYNFRVVQKLTERI